MAIEENINFLVEKILQNIREANIENVINLEIFIFFTFKLNLNVV